MNVYNSQFRKNKITQDRRQSKTLLTIDERGSKIDRYSVFDCHLWLSYFVSNDFDLRSSIITFSIAAYPV